MQAELNDKISQLDAEADFGSEDVDFSLDLDDSFFEADPLVLQQGLEDAEASASTYDQSSIPTHVQLRRKTDTQLAKTLKFTSSICAVVGGVLLSSNTSVSKYGFILLACSSAQIFISSLMLKDKSLMLYSGSLFVFVDCLGIYRWLLQSS